MRPTLDHNSVSTWTAARGSGKILDDTDPDDLLELRRFLYGLHAILRLHFTQEDEGYLSLVDDQPTESLTTLVKVPNRDIVEGT